MTKIFQRKQARVPASHLAHLLRTPLEFAIVCLARTQNKTTKYYLMCTIHARTQCKFDVRFGAFYCFVLLLAQSYCMNRGKKQSQQRLLIEATGGNANGRRTKKKTAQTITSNWTNEYEVELLHCDWQLNWEKWNWLWQ